MIHASSAVGSRGCQCDRDVAQTQQQAPMHQRQVSNPFLLGDELGDSSAAVPLFASPPVIAPSVASNPFLDVESSPPLPPSRASLGSIDELSFAAPVPAAIPAPASSVVNRFRSVSSVDTFGAGSLHLASQPSSSGGFPGSGGNPAPVANPFGDAFGMGRAPTPTPPMSSPSLAPAQPQMQANPFGDSMNQAFGNATPSVAPFQSQTAAATTSANVFDSFGSVASQLPLQEPPRIRGSVSFGEDEVFGSLPKAASLPSVTPATNVRGRSVSAAPAYGMGTSINMFDVPAASSDKAPTPTLAPTSSNPLAVSMDIFGDNPLSVNLPGIGAQSSQSSQPQSQQMAPVSTLASRRPGFADKMQVCVCVCVCVISDGGICAV
jgi:hypothetical protein